MTLYNMQHAEAADPTLIRSDVMMNKVRDVRKHNLAAWIGKCHKGAFNPSLRTNIVAWKGLILSPRIWVMCMASQTLPKR